MQHQRVDHNELADGVAAVHDVDGAHDHAGGEGDGEDHRLARVEDGQRGVGLDAGLLELLDGFVVALGLPGFCAEVLHRFVVEQAVDSLGVGVGVAVVHGFADGHAPFGGFDGEPEVADDHEHGDEGVTPIEGK